MEYDRKGSMFSVLRSAQQAIKTVAAISTARALHRDQWTTWWPGRKCKPSEEFACFQSVLRSKFCYLNIYRSYPSDSTCSYAFTSMPISCMHSMAVLACNAQRCSRSSCQCTGKKQKQELPQTHTCGKLLAGSNNAGIYTQVGCKRTGLSDLSSGVASACARLIVLTVRMTRLAIADVDVIDVRVGLQSEDEANQVRSRQQHRNGVHQWPGGQF